MLVAPVVLLMKRLVAEKGAHIGAEGAPAGIACADEMTERYRLMAQRGRSRRRETRPVVRLNRKSPDRA